MSPKRQPRPAEATRLAGTQVSAQHQTEVESCGLHQQAFGDVQPATQVDSAHAAGVVAMSKAALEQLAAAAQESLAPLAANAAAVGIGGPLLRALVAPAAAAPSRLGDVGPNAQLLTSDEHRIAVVAL